MIGYLSGTVQAMASGEKKIILLTQGVGYEVFVSLNVLGLCTEGQSIEMPIFTVVRENEISLYGFSDFSEKKVFEKLLGISGVGPKMALQIVSGPVDQFLSAVEAGDEAFITQTPGIGKKMAQKIIVDLRGKIDLSATQKNTLSPAMEEATEALLGLGYDRSSIELIFSQAPEGATAEDLVKFFLSQGA